MKTRTAAVVSDDGVIDLDAMAYLDEAKHNIIYPHDPKKTVLGSIIVAGPGHPQTLEQEEIERKHDLEELQEYQREAKDAIDEGRPVPRTPEERRTVAEIRIRNASRLAARIISANAKFKIGGSIIDLTKETAAQVLANPSIPWLYEGLFGFVRNRANFTPSSAPKS